MFLIYLLARVFSVFGPFVGCARRKITTICVKTKQTIRIRNPNPKRSESSDDDPDPTDVVLVPGKRSHPTVDVFVTALNIT